MYPFRPSECTWSCYICPHLSPSTSALLASWLAATRSTMSQLCRVVAALFSFATALQVPTLTLPGTLDKMPMIGYGTWLSAEGEVYEGTKAALRQGYRHIDEAWVYMNEAEVGRALNEALADGTVASRAELWVTSKLWQCHHRPELVREGCLESMTKLGVDCLDLYLMHFPVAFVPGCVEATSAEQMDDTPIEDTWRAMEALVDEGLVRSQ